MIPDSLVALIVEEARLAYIVALGDTLMPDEMDRQAKAYLRLSAPRIEYKARLWATLHADEVRHRTLKGGE